VSRERAQARPAASAPPQGFSRYVAAELEKAAGDGDVAEAAIALRIALIGPEAHAAGNALTPSAKTMLLSIHLEKSRRRGGGLAVRKAA
jgi:hypothetical protein